jgi:hypothetical protein
LISPKTNNELQRDLSQVERSTGISGQIVRKSGSHAQKIADGTLISMAQKDRWNWRRLVLRAVSGLFVQKFARPVLQWTAGGRHSPAPVSRVGELPVL